MEIDIRNICSDMIFEIYEYLSIIEKVKMMLLSKRLYNLIGKQVYDELTKIKIMLDELYDFECMEKVYKCNKDMIDDNTDFQFNVNNNENKNKKYVKYRKYDINEIVKLMSDYDEKMNGDDFIYTLIAIYINDERILYTPKLMCYAAYFGNIEIIKKFDNIDFGDKKYCIAASYAAINAHRDDNAKKCLMYLLKDGYASIFVIDELIKKSNISMIQWMKNNECEIAKDIIPLAALHGKLDIIKWAINNNFKYIGNTVGNAVNSGNTDVFVFTVYKFGYDPIVSKYAAINGNLKMLKYMMVNHYGIHNDVIYSAIQYGYIDIMDWCVQNEMPLKKSLFNHYSNINKYQRVIEWGRINIDIMI